jgi:acetate kinase
MKILVANVGSSSLKCRLIEMPSEKNLAKVHVERVGEEDAHVLWTCRDGGKREETLALRDSRAAIEFALSKLADKDEGALRNLDELDAVGFKPVCAKGITGCREMTDEVLDAMAEFEDYICPMHNSLVPAAVRAFREAAPGKPLIGLFETFFFQEWPEYAKIYSIPWDWTQKYDIRRSMGHGASHFFVNRRVAQLMGKKVEDFNSVQLHLGGSSSVIGVRGGVSVDGTAGFTMQAGLPMSVRSSDMDGFLIPFLWSKGEGTPKEIVDRMMSEAGLAGISGMGFDMRDLQAAAERGHERAALAIDTYVYQARKYIGSMMLILGHTDVITFAAGTGESSPYIRGRILEGLEEFGIVLDEALNEGTVKKEARISAPGSKIAVWVVPTDEEIVVARESYALLEKSVGRV